MTINQFIVKKQQTGGVGGAIMALSIKPTPILVGKEATRFEKRVRDNLKKPAKKAKRPDMTKAKTIAFGNGNEK